jgi:hypothetical protein
MPILKFDCRHRIEASEIEVADGRIMNPAQERKRPAAKCAPIPA